MSSVKVLFNYVYTFWSGNVISKFEVDGEKYVGRMWRNSDGIALVVISHSENKFNPVYVNNTGSSTMSEDVLKEHIARFVEELIIKKEREEGETE